MKKYFFFVSTLVIAFLFSSLAFVSETQAVSYVGKLVKASNKATVYYVASDGLKYDIPDENTYMSWYSDFSGIYVLSTKDLNAIKTAKYSVTIKPVKQLVKFDNSSKVYAVDAGAVLRWLKDEQTVKKYYGNDWYKNIKTLSQDSFSDYSFGEDIGSTTIYSKTRGATLASDIDAELRNRNLIANSTNKTTIVASADEPLLQYLKEDVKAGLSPRFNATENQYTLNTTFDESVLKLTLKSKNSASRILVNGTTVANASSIRLDLHVGQNDITIKLVNTSGVENVYFLQVFREEANDNNFLKTMTENLRDSFEPSFEGGTKEYDINAEYDESILKLNLKAEDKNTKIYVNDQVLSKGYYGTSNIFLSFGKSKIEIRLVAENGYNRYYYINVLRSQYPNLGDNDLAYLKENLDGVFSPEFDPKQSVYYLRATADETRVKISAKARNSKAKVVIDGQLTTSKYISIPYGDSEIYVIVNLPSAPAFNKKYTIHVYRDVE